MNMSTNTNNHTHQKKKICREVGFDDGLIRLDYITINVIIKYTLKNLAFSNRAQGFFFFLTHEKENSRETLRQLISGSTHTNPSLMDELPAVLLVWFACILIETTMRTEKAYLLLCVFS